MKINKKGLQLKEIKAIIGIGGVLSCQSSNQGEGWSIQFNLQNGNQTSLITQRGSLRTFVDLNLLHSFLDDLGFSEVKLNWDRECFALEQEEASYGA